MYSKTLQFIARNSVKRAEGFRQCLLVAYGTRVCMLQNICVAQNQGDTMLYNTSAHLQKHCRFLTQLSSAVLLCLESFTLLPPLPPLPLLFFFFFLRSSHLIRWLHMGS